jgi:hypothetical protein
MKAPAQAQQDAAQARFIAAVHDFSDDPNSTNLARYLAASRALEAARSASSSTQPQRVRRIASSQAAA